MNAQRRNTWVTSVLRGMLGQVGLAAATVALWWLWLGRDTTYQDGSGPYEQWQVAGCGATFLLLAVGAGLRLPWPALSVIVMAASFTVAWSIPASADDTGLWAVGAIMLAFGTTFGAVLGVRCGRRFRRRPAGDADQLDSSLLR